MQYKVGNIEWLKILEKLWQITFVNFFIFDERYFDIHMYKKRCNGK